MLLARTGPNRRRTGRIWLIVRHFRWERHAVTPARALGSYDIPAGPDEFGARTRHCNGSFGTAQVCATQTATP